MRPQAKINIRKCSVMFVALRQPCTATRRCPVAIIKLRFMPLFASLLIRLVCLRPCASSRASFITVTTSETHKARLKRNKTKFTHNRKIWFGESAGSFKETYFSQNIRKIKIRGVMRILIFYKNSDCCSSAISTHFCSHYLIQACLDLFFIFLDSGARLCVHHSSAGSLRQRSCSF